MANKLLGPKNPLGQRRPRRSGRRAAGLVCVVACGLGYGWYQSWATAQDLQQQLAFADVAKRKAAAEKQTAIAEKQTAEAGKQTADAEKWAAIAWGDEVRERMEGAACDAEVAREAARSATRLQQKAEDQRKHAQELKTAANSTTAAAWKASKAASLAKEKAEEVAAFIWRLMEWEFVDSELLRQAAENASRDQGHAEEVAAFAMQMLDWAVADSELAQQKAKSAARAQRDAEDARKAAQDKAEKAEQATDRVWELLLEEVAAARAETDRQLAAGEVRAKILSLKSAADSLGTASEAAELHAKGVSAKDKNPWRPEAEAITNCATLGELHTARGDFLDALAKSLDGFEKSPPTSSARRGASRGASGPRPRTSARRRRKRRHSARN